MVISSFTNYVSPYATQLDLPTNVMLGKLLDLLNYINYPRQSSFLFVCLFFNDCSLSLLLSNQHLTHVKRMMDVVPVHICVSSITTALCPAPVHTSWSFQPTNNPALVSGNTFLICHTFALCYERKNTILRGQQERHYFRSIYLSC